MEELGLFDEDGDCYVFLFSGIMVKGIVEG